MKHTTRAALFASSVFALAGTLFFARRFAQLAPARPGDAVESGRLMLQGGQQVLAFTAHPDDLELFCGGTLRRLHQLGCPITVVDATDGEKGVNMQNLAPRRQREQRQAGRLLGYDDIRFLHFPDLELKDSAKLNQRVKQVWEQVNPQMVLAFDYREYHPWIKHNDHITFGRVVVDVAGELDSDASVYLYGTALATTAVDIGPVLAVKQRAVTSHSSQLRFGPVPAAKAVKLIARASARNTPYRYVETFRCLHNVHNFVPPRKNIDPGH